jgi:hypothetical protein
MDEISEAILEVWNTTEKKLRKDKVGRELFKELLKRTYERMKNE